MSALRCEAPVQISKRAIAAVQLVEAIKLFLDERYIPSITLAGASEEVLARLLNQAGEKGIAEISAVEIEKLRKETGLPILGNGPERELFNLWNSARNGLKHHNKNEEEMFVMHPFDDAYMMIRRALYNAKALGVDIANSQEFDNWRKANAL